MKTHNNEIQTATGGLIKLKKPRPQDINIQDIALALSRICRFGGHLRADLDHYSVAQHSMLVADHCSPRNKAVALLHDAAEAYLGDVISPLKKLLLGYKMLEHNFNRAIGERFNLGNALNELPDEVKHNDLRALATERRDLMINSPELAERWVITAEPLEEIFFLKNQKEACNLFLRYAEKVL